MEVHPVQQYVWPIGCSSGSDLGFEGKLDLHFWLQMSSSHCDEILVFASSASDGGRPGIHMTFWPLQSVPFTPLPLLVLLLSIKYASLQSSKVFGPSEVVYVLYTKWSSTLSIKGTPLACTGCLDCRERTGCNGSTPSINPFSADRTLVYSLFHCD